MMKLLYRWLPVGPSTFFYRKETFFLNLQHLFSRWGKIETKKERSEEQTHSSSKCIIFGVFRIFLTREKLFQRTNQNTVYRYWKGPQDSFCLQRFPNYTGVGLDRLHSSIFISLQSDFVLCVNHRITRRLTTIPILD